MKPGEYRFRAEVYVQFTQAELALVLFCSERHYDGKCKLASRQGGFLYGVKNRMDVHFEIHEATEELPYHGISTDDMDTLCKILETPPLDRQQLGFQLHQQVRKLLVEMIHQQQVAAKNVNVELPK